MYVRDISGMIESWAPPAIAWERDNVGLLVGSPDSIIRKVLVCLDATPAVIDEAISMRTGLIVSHHPLMFAPLRQIDPGTRNGGMLASLLRHRIGLYAAHTNLDFTTGGVSHTLAERLGLKEISPLSPLAGKQKKIVVFVPPSHAGGVMQAMAGAGAGVIGKYESCSFTTGGTGSFLPGPGSDPFLGSSGRFERVNEVRLEMECPQWKVPAVVRAMKAAHPYDEAAFDVYSLENASRDFGMGAIGRLPRPAPLRTFLRSVSSRLGAAGVRYSGPSARRIRSVAVCGGSGADLLPEAVRAGADAFVTADIRYHSFQEFEREIVLVDAGHYETERPAVGAITRFLRSAPQIRKERIAVIESKKSINPVNYFR
ncbi:MAG TPA: Nif3-like dinuclear metal center hexameric protein [Bacteroidota bacterium]|nr:Nif3-like dinuclear metal center hexameric protein [Bacteroidota bacterium]